MKTHTTIVSLFSVLCFTMCSTHVNTDGANTIDTDIQKAPNTAVDTPKKNHLQAHVKKNPSPFVYRNYEHIKRNIFMGTWSENKDENSELPETEYIEIDPDTSVYSIVRNQLDIECKNDYHGDTLYLYVISSNQANRYNGPKFLKPKTKSLFAKCFIFQSELRIIYKQKLFNKNKIIALNNVLYKNSDHGIEFYNDLYYDTLLANPADNILLIAPH